MSAKADTLGSEIRQATRDVMASKKNLPFLAILLIFHTELARVKCNVN